MDVLIKVEACDEGSTHATYVGTAHFDTLFTNKDGEDEKCRLTIKDVYFCPEMNTDLLSLGIFVRHGLSFRASKDLLTVTDDNDTILEGALVDTASKLRLSESDDSKASEIVKAMSAKTLPHQATAKEWHKTMGH